MDFKKKTPFALPTKDMADRSVVNYLLKEDFYLKHFGEQSFQFDPVSGKFILSMWVKTKVITTGLNMFTLLGENGQEVLRLDTEGAYYYTHDGNRKMKLFRYTNDAWHSLYVTVNLKAGTYSLFIDSERYLHNATLPGKAQAITALACSSQSARTWYKNLCIYKPQYESVEEAACGKPIVNAKERGIVADGVTDVTADLQRLIDSVGDSVLYLEGGTFLSGQLFLRSDLTLYIEENATLKGILGIEHYPIHQSEQHPNMNTAVQGPQRALLVADTCRNIRIIGGGTIDGSGDFPGIYDTEPLRPSGLLIIGCENTEVANVYITDAGMWTSVYVECEDLYLHDLNIYSTWYPNRDGIDLCDCVNVLVECCNIMVDDDAICSKSGNESGCDNVLVRHCMASSTMANALKFGTYSYGGFKNYLCENCLIKDTHLCGITVQSVDGGDLRNLLFRDIIMQNLESTFMVVVGEKGRHPAWGEHRVGSIQDVTFMDIEASGVTGTFGTYLGGYQSEDGTCYRAKNIRLENIRVACRGGITEVPPTPKEFQKTMYPESNCFGTLPACGYFIRHADNVVFRNCETMVAFPDAREEFVTYDCTGIVRE